MMFRASALFAILVAAATAPLPSSAQDLLRPRGRSTQVRPVQWADEVDVTATHGEDDTPMLSDVPSDMPSYAPSSMPVEEDGVDEDGDDNGPVSVFDKEEKGDEEEIVEEGQDDGPGINKDLCSVGDYLPFVVPGEEAIFEYKLESGDAAFDTEGIVFNVSSVCEYGIYEKTLTIPDVYSTPNDWINAVVLYFGGIPRISNGATLTGTAAPKASEVSLEPFSNIFWEVLVDKESKAVDGGEPLMFGFPEEAKAQKFKTFLLTILEEAPGIFLKSETALCGSGPTCVKMGEDVCYYDSANEKLGLIEKDGSEKFYDNSLQWFNHCAASLGCTKHERGNEQLLYLGSPNVSVEGTTFQFGNGDTVPVMWECNDVQDAHALKDFVEMATLDPFKPFAVGGIYQHSEDLD